MANVIKLKQESVMAAALLVDTIYMEYSTFTMPKELRHALNTLHQRVRDLAVSQEAEPAQKSLALEEVIPDADDRTAVGRGHLRTSHTASRQRNRERYGA